MTTTAIHPDAPRAGISANSFYSMRTRAKRWATSPYTTVVQRAEIARIILAGHGD